MTLSEVLDKLYSIGFYNIWTIIILIFISVPVTYEGIKQWKKMLGKSNRELKDEKIINDINALDKRIGEVENKMDTRIDSLFSKQKGYHEETLNIRENLVNNQEKLFNSISVFSDLLKEIKTDLVEERMERKRWNILNFANELRYSSKDIDDVERFNNIFRDIDDYEKIIEEQGFNNGFAEESIKFIKIKYQELLNKKG